MPENNLSTPEIRTMPLADLTSAPYNPRKISDAALEGLRASVKRFGLVQPIVWNKRSGHVVGGHQRLKVLSDAGEERASVIVVDLPSAEEKALNVTLNNPHVAGEWTVELGSLLEGLKIDLPDLFDDLALDALGKDVPRDATEIVEDDVPEPPKVAVAKTGDLWTLGQHRLLCGDNRPAENVAKVTGGGEPGLVLTDPPYGIGIVKGQRGSIGGAKPVTIGRVGSSQPQPLGFGTLGRVGSSTGGNANRSNRAMVPATMYLPIQGDDGPFDPRPLLTLGRQQIIFGAHNFAHLLPTSRCWIVWDKENGSSTFGDAELAWASHDRATKLYRHKWNGLVREGSRAVEGVRRIHPTQKPVGLFGAILRDFSENGESILDPFLGSGTTLIAAEQLSRRCFGLEIEPRYCDVIVERWQNLTGQKATRE